MNGLESELSNPLLISMNEIFPSIALQLRAAAPFSAFQKGTLSDYDEISRTSEVLLSTLLSVISTMVELSGEFMASRFETSVWPVITTVLDHLYRFGTTKAISINCKRKERLTIIILQCLCSALSSSRLGCSLQHLVIEVGTILMPLLGNVGDVGELAVMTIEALLSIDSDALLRGILCASGRGLPTRLLLPFPVKKEASYTPLTDRLMVDRSQCLLKYIDILPEKRLR